MSQDRIRALEQIIEQQNRERIRINEENQRNCNELYARTEKAEDMVRILEKIIKHQNSQGAVGEAMAVTADGKVYMGSAMPEIGEPMVLDIKLASIIVHVQELLSPDGREADKQAILGLLQDQDVVTWLKSFDPALLPLKRKL